MDHALNWAGAQHLPTIFLCERATTATKEWREVPLAGPNASDPGVGIHVGATVVVTEYRIDPVTRRRRGCTPIGWIGFLSPHREVLFAQWEPTAT
jgi:hypothetical protein